MANAFAGQALMDIGKNLPGMFRTNQQTEEEKKLNEIRKKMMEEELMASEVDRAFKTQEEGRKKTAFDIQNEIGNLMKPVDTALPEGVEGPQLPERYAPGMDLGAALSKTGAASMADQPGIEKLLTLQSKEGNEKTGGMFVGWKKKNDDRDMILSGVNPYGENAGKPFSGPEETKTAMDEWETRWNTSGKLGLTPEYIEGAATRAATVQRAQIPGKTVEAEVAGAAGVRGRAAGETESNVNSIPGFEPIGGIKITNESVKKVKDSAPLIQNINSIVDTVLSDIKAKGYKYTGDDAASYNSNIRYLQMLAKSEPVFNLGVITGPDLMLLDQIVADPSSLKQGMKSTVLGSVEKRLQEFKKNLNNGASAQYKVNGFKEVKSSGNPEFDALWGD